MCWFELGLMVLYYHRLLQLNCTAIGELLLLLLLLMQVWVAYLLVFAKSTADATAAATGSRWFQFSIYLDQLRMILVCIIGIIILLIIILIMAATIAKLFLLIVDFKFLS